VREEQNKAKMQTARLPCFFRADYLQQKRHEIITASSMLLQRHSGYWLLHKRFLRQLGGRNRRIAHDITTESCCYNTPLSFPAKRCGPLWRSQSIHNL